MPKGREARFVAALRVARQGRERPVPLDVEAAGLIQACLLAERLEIRSVPGTAVNAFSEKVGVAVVTGVFLDS